MSEENSTFPQVSPGRPLESGEAHAPGCVRGFFGEGTHTCEPILAPNGPLTPGQVTCRVCQLDDRTRAASRPDDGLCDVCREGTPNRVAQFRRKLLQSGIEEFLGLEPNRDMDEFAEGAAEVELRQERADVLMKLADLVAGHSYPEALLQRAMDERRVCFDRHHIGKCLRPGDTVRLWGVADRTVDSTIHYGVDGPISWPQRVVLEDDEIRLRLVTDAQPDAAADLAKARGETPGVTRTTLKEEAAEALAALEAAPVVPFAEIRAKALADLEKLDSEAAAAGALDTQSTTPDDPWGPPDLAKNCDATLSGDRVLVYFEDCCTCDGGAIEVGGGHQEWCGWQPEADTIPWLKKLAPGVKFLLADASGPRLETWTQLYDVPNAELRDWLQTAEADAPGKYHVYALVRVPDEAVRHDG